MFGRVFRGFSVDTNQEVAIKVIRNSKVYSDQAKTEIKLLEALKHKNVPVVKIIESFYYLGFPIIIFELLKETLSHFLLQRTDKVYLAEQVYSIGKQILETLVFLNRDDIKIIHGDLKPDNIMLTFNPMDHDDESPSIKVIDFGSSTYMHEQIHTYIQSRRYRAPEVYIQSCHYTPAVDMWSFGCILAEIFAGKPLFCAKSTQTLFQVINKIPLYIYILIYNIMCNLLI